MRALRALGEAFGYFSILPAGRWTSGPPGGTALAMLPLVGAVTGAIAGAIGYAAHAWLHVGWAFVAAWAGSMVLTGAVHVDGFLDACDALFATATPQRRMEILRDPRHGTFAVVGMALLAAFWLAALAPIAPARYPLALAFAAAAARLTVTPNAWVFPYGRGEGVAAELLTRPDIAAYVLAFALVEVLAWFVRPPMLLAAPLVILGSLLAGRWASRRLGGGLTGDCYGAFVVVAEVTILLAVGLQS